MENKSGSKYIILLLCIIIIGFIGFFGKWYVFPKFFQNVEPKNTSLQVIKTTQTDTPVIAKSFVNNANQANDFALDSSSFSTESVVALSNFELGEVPAWQGNGVIDQKVFFEGMASLDLVSTDHHWVTITLQKNMDLSKMESIEFMINVSDPDMYEAANLDFGDLEFKNFYRYSLTNLKLGWNLIQIPKDKFIQVKAPESELTWANLSNIRFSVLSRPNSMFLVRLDALRSINNQNEFTKYWRVGTPTFLSLYPQNGKNKIMARCFSSINAVMKDLEDINDFGFGVSISPQTSGRSGLFIRGNYDNGYGYYFFIGGDKRNTWEIQKRNKDGWTKPEEKIQGVIQNVVFSKDKTYWLRVEAKGDVMEFYFSFDGQKYEKFGEIIDSEFRGGGVGITVLDGGSWSLFDDFQFKRY